MTGCRVLPATGNSLFKRSRETHFEINNNIQPRVLSIVGGKLTVYRQTANKVMKILQQTLPETAAYADTANLKLRPVD